MKSRAFTLLELLVVITIIGILSSIVIVSMPGSTDSATIAKGKAYAQQVHALLGHEAVLDLSFNENTYNTCSDGADVCDTSGYSNNGTIYQDSSGAAFASSSIDGYALSFDGIDDYVNVPRNSTLEPQNLTLGAWIRPNIVTGDRMIFDKPYTSHSNPYYSYEMRIQSGHIFFAVVVGAAYSNDDTVIDGIITAENWYHVVGTYDGTIRLYINGVKITEKSNPGIISYYDKPLTVGKSQTYSAFFKGLIDEVRIYSEALPAAEIQKHYVQGLERLFSKGDITQSEYDQRMEEFNQYLVQYGAHKPLPFKL